MDYEAEEEWNMAFAYFKRLDFLLTMCSEYQIKGDGLKWFEVLRALYKEIYPKLKPELKKEADKLIS